MVASMLFVIYFVGIFFTPIAYCFATATAVLSITSNNSSISLSIFASGFWIFGKVGHEGDNNPDIAGHRASVVTSDTIIDTFGLTLTLEFSSIKRYGMHFEMHSSSMGTHQAMMAAIIKERY